MGRDVFSGYGSETFEARSGGPGLIDEIPEEEITESPKTAANSIAPPSAPPSAVPIKYSEVPL